MDRPGIGNIAVKFVENDAKSGRSSRDNQVVGDVAGQGLTSVDDIDSAGGQIALVLALQGAHGSFGYKKTADSPLPQSPGGAAGP